jgi:undecaprenyl-diphosphatase
VSCPFDLEEEKLLSRPYAGLPSPHVSAKNPGLFMTGDARDMGALEAFGIAVLQGATELFPVSSLGHAVVLPAVLNWHLDQHDPAFLPFLVMLHLGTASALILYFWRDWLGLAQGVLGFAGADDVRASRRLFALIVVATIPGLIVGFLLEKWLRGLFASAPTAAIVLVFNGTLLLFGERLRAHTHRPLADVTALDALCIGLWQCTALIPGISRSGATIVGGLLRGIDHEGAAHFSFLIATPIILAATVLEVPKLLKADVAPGVFQLAAFSALAAGATALAATAFLMRYFRRHDEWALNPFAYYCIGVGLAAALYLGLR